MVHGLGWTYHGLGNRFGYTRWNSNRLKNIFCARGTFGANHVAKLIAKPRVHLVQPCTYLVLRLTEPPDGLKRAYIWPTLPRSSIGYAQNDFRAHGTFGANHAPMSPRLTPSPTESKRSSTWPTSPRGFYRVRPKWFLNRLLVQRIACTYLVSRLALSQKRPKWTSIWPTSPRSSIVCPKRFMSLWYVSPNPSTYLALRVTLSLNGPKWASTWPTSPRSSIGCAQSDFRAYCTFSVNYAPILCGD
jgi:hypothetical protein